MKDTIDDSEGKGYGDDVKRLYWNTNAPLGKLIRSLLARRWWEK